jgi:hypothetical protein
LASGEKLPIPVEFAISIASPSAGLEGMDATFATSWYCTEDATAFRAAAALELAVFAVVTADAELDRAVEL